MAVGAHCYAQAPLLLSLHSVGLTIAHANASCTLQRRKEQRVETEYQGHDFAKVHM